MIKDALLLLILIGIGLSPFQTDPLAGNVALRRTTKHVLGDRIALTALWFIFPARLLAESFTSGVLHGNSVASAGLWATRCTLSRRESAAAVS
ncbi:MAG: hypothetical protein ACLR8Y_11700 [Alistipes indistinctus]